jgi:G:T-mismatch repair DNA endonuclease (very short patch repair protein)
MCKNCGKYFESKITSKIFCSKKCGSIYYIKNPIKHRYIMVCNYCGISFEKTLANKPDINENHYCSPECIGYNKNKIGTGKICFCKECGKEFSQIHKRHYFCCDKCKTVHGIKHVITKEVFCSFCNKSLKRPRSLKNKNYFCDRICEGSFRENEANDVRTCRYCKKEFTCKKHDRLVFCSKSCQINGFNKGATKPHLDVMKFLDDCKIRFEIEKPVKRYSVDVYLLESDINIEVMGQYWHCDHRIYEEPKSEMHLYAIKKDKKKSGYFRKNNMPVLYLWEIDINNNFDVCKMLIMEFIKSCGILNNCHSMNYEINNEELILKDKILVPHFERN